MTEKLRINKVWTNLPEKPKNGPRKPISQIKKELNKENEARERRAADYTNQIYKRWFNRSMADVRQDHATFHFEQLLAGQPNLTNYFDLMLALKHLENNLVTFNGHTSSQIKELIDQKYGQK